MKIFSLIILKQKTLDELLAKVKRDAIVMPNKMISKLLGQLHKAEIKIIPMSTKEREALIEREKKKMQASYQEMRKVSF